MRSTPPYSTRRDLRARRARRGRRPALIAAGLGLSLFAVAGIGATSSVASSTDSAPGSAPTFELASFTTVVAPTGEIADGATDPISADAHDALAGAQAARAAAVKIADDIETSKLKVGTPDTTVDTDELDAAALRLAGALDLPAPLIPGITEDVSAEIASVQGEVAGLQERLDDAQEAKAKAVAAAKAKKKAEAAAKAKAAAEAAAEAAEAAAAQAAEVSAPAATPSTPVPTGSGGMGAAAAKATAQKMASAKGWGADQFSCLVSLWDKESGWNYKAYNASSGAYGIPQALPGSKMASAGADWQTNAATQISWGFGYISGRYGNPCGAWSHSQSVGWY